MSFEKKTDWTFDDVVTEDDMNRVEQGIADAHDEIDNHKSDKSNPHSVTKTQVGLGNVDNVQQAPKTDFDAHVANRSNPHGATSQQITIVTSITDASTSGDTYPFGVTTFNIGEGSTGYPTQYGTVLNVKHHNSRFTQWFYRHGATASQIGAYFRHWYTGVGWTEWQEVETVNSAQAKVDAIKEWTQSYGLGATLDSDINWNDESLESGFYRGLRNGPHDFFVTGVHLRSSNGDIYQLVGSHGKQYVRTKEFGVWSEWRISETTVDAQEKVNQRVLKSGDTMTGPIRHESDGGEFVTFDYIGTVPVPQESAYILLCQKGNVAKRITGTFFGQRNSDSSATTADLVHVTAAQGNAGDLRASLLRQAAHVGLAVRLVNCTYNANEYLAVALETAPNAYHNYGRVTFSGYRRNDDMRVVGPSEVSNITPFEAVSAIQMNGVDIETTAGSQAKVDAHANLSNNPHGVTAQQVGAPTTAQFNSHANAINNPHGVTKAQVGLGNVQNYMAASQNQAETGIANDRYMTPLRTKQAIDTLQAVKSVAGKTGAVSLSKGDVGLANVDNVKQASKTEFDAHLSDYMQLKDSSEIVEEGENSNGRYTRWASGLQVCYIARLNLTYSSAVAISDSWTFPASFLQTQGAQPPYVGGNLLFTYATPGVREILSPRITFNNGSSAVCTVSSVVGAPNFQSDDEISVYMFAIGRWK